MNRGIRMDVAEVCFHCLAALCRSTHPNNACTALHKNFCSCQPNSGCCTGNNISVVMQFVIHDSFHDRSKLGICLYMYHAGGWKGISQWVEKGVDSGWISCLILQQPQFPCPVDSLDAGLNPQLAVNIVDVCLDCAGSNIQFGGNFLIGETRIHQG